MISLILARGINDHWKATVWIICNANYISMSRFFNRHRHLHRHYLQTLLFTLSTSRLNVRVSQIRRWLTSTSLPFCRGLSKSRIMRFAQQRLENVQRKMRQ